MTEEDKIQLLRKAVMCAVVHLFNTNPEDVCNMFTLEELDEIATQTEQFGDEALEGIFKDVLTMSE